MGEYYDKNKFTGGSPGQGQTPPSSPPPYQPPPKRKENTGWYSWPVIIILFCVGAWPIALALLLYNIFSENKRKDQQNAAVRRRAMYEAQARSAVERAMDKAGSSASRASAQAEKAVEKAETQVGRAFDQAGKSVDEAVAQAMSQMEKVIDRAAKEVSKAGKARPAAYTTRTPPKAPTVKQAKPKKQKAKPAGVALRILGIICLAIAGILGWVSLMDGFNPEPLNVMAGFLGAGGIMFGRGSYLNKMSRRSQRYILAIGNVDAMPIDEIAKRVNRKPGQAEKELQKLIDKGYLGEDAYIDHERGYFLRFGATLEEEEEESPFVEEPAPEPTPKEAQEGYSGVLRNIRHANDRIADPELSRKIDRLEQVSALIFKEVEEHPEKRNSIHTFFDYYLPTTQKLLDTYADFEETGVEGENLRQAKARIEQTMDLIVAGFEHQLDQLYSADAMDVDSDIRVMEAMLKRDTASVAKDFGFPEPPKVRPREEKKSSDHPDDDGQMLTMQ